MTQNPQLLLCHYLCSLLAGNKAEGAMNLMGLLPTGAAFAVMTRKISLSSKQGHKGAGILF